MLTRKQGQRLGNRAIVSPLHDTLAGLKINCSDWDLCVEYIVEVSRNVMPRHRKESGVCILSLYLADGTIEKKLLTYSQAIQAWSG